MRVLVLGGKGFIGRYTVRALQARGSEVVIGTRHARLGPSNKGNEIALCLQKRTQADDWTDAIAPFDVVVNCAGILRERWGESFAAVYHLAPVAINEACAAQGKRFIHITALGLNATSSSGFITAKLAGEQGIARIGGQACVVRPSLLDGIDGFGSRWVRRVAQWPLHFVPADALGALAPLAVHDLGEAIAALCLCSREALPGSVELGGETRYTMLEYLRALRSNARPALRLPVPAWMVRICAHLFDILHVTPLSWGHVELMRRDNAPCAADAKALRHWIGRVPRDVGSAVSTPASGAETSATASAPAP